ncbi:Uncharcterized protein, DUF927 family [Marinobacter sp. DSM 26671]|uniref:DUF927 domain-containing protein n=1 Tax=Marinobacter sp. DSM 26671 TaxID=1761793 RepID=UPI0008F0F3D8|nr:DUF927 domain-containing protein [Marinobacter sp. DSM 26671]SFE55037.1 Uncharcterized protein, DUF927 family [Marinobacter sp. DSM 26671]
MKDRHLVHKVTEGMEGTVNGNANLGVPQPPIRGDREGTAPFSGQQIIEPVSPMVQPPTNVLEPEIDRPCFKTHDDWFALKGSRKKPGLYWHGYKPTKGDAAPEEVDIWISSPIHAEAETSDELGSGHGLMLRFCDSRGTWKRWAAPLVMLKGSGEELRGELLDNGVRINPRAQRLLIEWMMEQYPKHRIVAATRTGWTRDNTAFVLPGKTIGNHKYCFQSEHAAHDAYTRQGSLSEWRESISAYCSGNPLLILAVSCSLAAPLLRTVAQRESGGAGLHLLGDSSKGKTTALQVAASVWGSPGYVLTWRATGNGLEATAAARNDTLLPLDEISESNPKEIGAVVYALANGHGKQRASRTGGARESQRWRVLLLSSGERSLAAHMGEANQKAKAGQQARLLDIPATSRRFGLFDHLHGHGTPRAFADYLKRATGRCYGLIGPAFVEAFLEDNRDLKERYAEVLEAPEFAGRDGLESRAAGTFALLGVAGELAIDYGLTLWSQGDAFKAALEAFTSWRDNRGFGQNEDSQILVAVRDFIARHGSARFSSCVETDGGTVIRDRAGYWRDDLGGRVYLFFSHGLREAASGFDLKRILQALDNAGWIVEREKGKNSKKIRIGNDTPRLYWIRPIEEAAE